MNLSHQFLTQFKLYLQSIIWMGVAAIFISSQAQADGVILIKSHPTQSPNFWRAFTFSKNEASPFNYTITLLNGQQQNFFKSEVGAIIEEPKWNELIIVTDVDWQKLEQQKNQLISSVAQYPQLKKWINNIITKFDELINSRSSSNVLYRGRIIAKEEFDKLQGTAPATPSSSSAALTLGEKQFMNVKILSIKGGRLGFSHDGGIAGVQMSSLDTKQTEWVKSNAPQLYEAHIKEILLENTSKSAGSKMSPASNVEQPSTNPEKSVAQDSNMAADSKIELMNKNSSILLQPQNAGSQVDLLITDDLSQTFVFVPAGSFTMGSPLDEEGRIKSENQIEVTLSQPFWLAQTEVTQAQWEAVMGTNPSRFKGTNLPVENVTWTAAQGFIAKLNAKQILPDRWKFALPTEAQWEYACRAGKEGPGFHRLDEVAWYDRNSGGMTHKVGQKTPNNWGFYDMHGNVWEWCADWFEGALKGGTDPVGPSTGRIRVSRGGAWFYEAEACRAAMRIGAEPDDLDPGWGLRPALIRDDADINNLIVGQPDTSAWLELEQKWMLYDKKLTENTKQLFNTSKQLDKLYPISVRDKVSKNEQVKLSIELERLANEQIEILSIRSELRKEAKRLDPTNEKFKKLLDRISLSGSH
jgi:formylglycine-generating enzyme required for sulfatase activity